MKALERLKQGSTKSAIIRKKLRKKSYLILGQVLPRLPEAFSATTFSLVLMTLKKEVRSRRLNRSQSRKSVFAKEVARDTGKVGRLER